MKRPLTGLAIVFASGIWIGSLARWPGAGLWFAAAGLLIAFFLLSLFRGPRWSLPPLLLLVLVTGMIAQRSATVVFDPDDVTRLLAPRDQNIEMRGTILGDTGMREVETDEAAVARRPGFIVALAALKQGGQWRRACGKVLVFARETGGGPALRYGDVIECTALLRVPPRATNPGVFDWAAWLAEHRISFTATIRAIDSCAVLAHDQGNPLTALSLRLRARFERALRLGLENEPEMAGVLVGMVIGARSDIPPDTYQDFQRTGVFHVFAINGLHVGLVLAVVLVALRTLQIPRRWAGLMAMPLLTVYVFATGAHPGAVRALLMAGVWFGSWLLVRPMNALNGLAAAALILLVWEPTQLFDGGFILSFSVVAALVVMTPLIQKRLVALVSRDPLLPRSQAPGWRSHMDQPLTWLAQLVSCSLAAWLGLMPLMAWYFHLFTPISVLANVLVIPLLTSVIALGLTATLVYAAWPGLTLILNNANLFLLQVMTRGVESLGHVPVVHQYVVAPPLWIVGAYYLAAVLLLSRRIARARKKLAAAIAVPAICLAALVTAWRDEAVEITVLDLRDGMAVFVNAPGAQHDLLIDGGGSEAGGRRVVVPFLRAQGVDRLGGVVLSCGDKSHAAGFTAVTAEVPIAQAIHSGAATRSKYYGQCLDDWRQRTIPIRTVRAGDDLALGPTIRLTALHPPRELVARRSDDNALVLRLESGPTRVLLLSDAGATVERRLLESSADLSAAIVVKGRHGKEPSCTPEFLDAVKPDAVVQVVGVWPSGRYIEPELPARLAERGVALYRTDETGAVTIRLTARGYTIKPWRAADSRLASN